jgi:deoxycytidylate deaminase
VVPTVSNSQLEIVSWETYFMNIANMVKIRSKDPKMQVGAVLVSLKDNRIISTGYNSVRSGLNDSKIDWTDRDRIKDIVIHAESNAILYAQSKFEDSVLYTTHSPCNECLKLLSATKIKKIVYNIEYRDFNKTIELCKYFDIELVKYIK